ncbi:hypothetical protein PHISP_01557 [Aspergillus sp. HF37]|nr:hypothetical protein PHISP_01557 [Aspergillus sp. HF37]
MENVTDDPFPHGTVLKKFEGTIYELGDKQFRSTSIQKEQLEVMGIARRDATFDAENVKTGEPVVLKLRADPSESSIESYRTMTRRTFREEVHRFQQGSFSSGYTPDYIAHAELHQDDRYEYPAGFLGALVLSKNPRRTDNIASAMSAGEIRREDLGLLARRCEEMFRTFRERGLRLGLYSLDLEYEPETMRPYVSEPEKFTDVEPGQPSLSGLYEMRHIEFIIFDRFGEDIRREVFDEASWQWYWNEGW